MSIDVSSPGGSAASLGLALLKLVLPCNAPITPSNNDSFELAPQLSVGITYIQQGAVNYGAIQLPHAVAGAIVILLSANDAGNFISVLTQTDETVNDQYDQIDWNPVGNYNDMPAPLIFYCPSDGAWWTNGQLD